MRFVRVILALVIVLSVAMLPMVRLAASMISATAQGASEVASMDMAMMSAAMDDCCPDHAKTKPCDPLGERCPMAFCAAQLVSIASPSVFQFDFPVLLAKLLPIPVDQVVALHSGTPPFRPPRV